jgi:hypothetical protein
LNDQLNRNVQFKENLEVRKIMYANEDYEPEIFIEQYALVRQFLLHVVYYRELKQLSDEYQPKSEFWTNTINAHLLQAAIYWSMVFGSDGCNPTHWKKLSAKNSNKLQTSFRDEVCEFLGIDFQQWKHYWKNLTDFRNQYVAHRELKFKKPVPSFDTAINVAFFYDKWIRKIIHPDILDIEGFEKYAEELKLASIPLIKKLIQITKDYNQSKNRFV